MLIELVKNYLKNEFKSEKLEFGENLFINFYPDSPNTIISLIDLGGMPPTLYTPIREKIIEFKYRVDSLSQGEELGDELIELFHDKENYYLDGTRILHSYCRTDASYLYKDDDERLEYSLEVVFVVERKIKK